MVGNKRLMLIYHVQTIFKIQSSLVNFSSFETVCHNIYFYVFEYTFEIFVLQHSINIITINYL